MKAYCSNQNCPFKDCDRHIRHVRGRGVYIFGDYAGSCRRYITWLVKSVERRYKHGISES